MINKYDIIYVYINYNSRISGAYATPKIKTAQYQNDDI